ncbi:MAG: helix-turn-helix transcriptional regulator [Clostridia bacterium]|nr:helix-turn-helix transcriptional regulator [Clostridia bacterium]
MDLSRKIYELRKQRGLTQEQFAEMLFVSRTAVSKWETGRGTPGMGSLQMIAKVCDVSLDELLSTGEAIRIAEKENRETLRGFAACADAAAALGIFLPLYKAEAAQMFYSVPLYRFGGRFVYLYWILISAMALCGILRILISRSDREKAKAILRNAGLAINAAAVFALILSGQPYPAALFFVLLLLKGAVLLPKRR